mmetsp:Transcript_14233/g.35716  ORF Transcript_14233/g.35716 Transcript_14233/m.35716 type:complete len:423 (-) Transcript_14233:23-1291(-)
MYPPNVVFTLIGMITAGAGRIVAVKVYFQIEIEESRTVTPLFVTLLYLVGQTLSLFVHYTYITINPPSDGQRDEFEKISYETIEMVDRTLDENDDDNTPSLPKSIDSDEFGLGMPSTLQQSIDDDEETSDIWQDEAQHSEHRFVFEDHQTPRWKPRRRGSKTGLTKESKDAVAWIHNIPWYLKPAIPGFFNLCNSALRWACLVFVAASTAEILISGMELVLSSFAARIIRKRKISKRRWVGISIVTLGIMLVGFTKAMEKKEIKDEEQRFFIGNLLILGQCVFSVLQDLSEEIFMQEAEFPATLLLGMEGLFGLVFGVPIYLIFFSEEVIFTRFNVTYESGLVILVLITGILNIRTTEITSSMTRNVWKQFRIMLVWSLGLLVYYVGSNNKIGEPWVFPSSLFVLGGFSVILTGVHFYYSEK